MKKNFFLLLCIPFLSYSQNIGIGTTTPQKLLHLKGTGEVLRIQGSFPWIGFMNDANSDYGGFLYYPDTSLVMGSRAGTNLPLILAPNNNGLLFATSNQRIGIGAPTPIEKLDVNGNINVSGTIKANGTDGSPGQVLMKNSSGTLSWSDLSEYKNFETFRTVGTNAWTVPAGVTKICIELWGGGGGGSNFGGGGGGGYIKAYFTVTPGSSVSYTIGTGGSGGNTAGTTAATAGDNSTASVGSVTITASGGSPSLGNGVLDEWPGTGGTFSVTGSFRNYIGADGENGAHNNVRYEQRNATTFYIITKYGNGGNAGNTTNTGGVGNVMITNEATGVVVKDSYALSPKIPGGGGASFVCSICNGTSGAKGQMIIYY